MAQEREPYHESGSIVYESGNPIAFITIGRFHERGLRLLSLANSAEAMRGALERLTAESEKDLATGEFSNIAIETVRAREFLAAHPK